mgnify:CR=1 FL=1
MDRTLASCPRSIETGYRNSGEVRVTGPVNFRKMCIKKGAEAPFFKRVEGSVDRFEQTGSAHATTNTHTDDAVLLIATVQFA